MRGRLILSVAGLVAMLVGSSSLLAPIAFRQSAGIEIERTASALSETRAPGAALLAVGVLIFVGALHARHRRVAAFASATLYLSFACGRVLGIVLDGWPHESLVVATGVELALGLLSAWVSRIPASTTLPGTEGT